MADKQIYTFNNEIDTVEISSLGAKITLMPEERADIYVEYDNPKDSPEFCAVLSGKTLTLKENLSFSVIGNKPSEEYAITAHLPLKTYQKIKINTASGGVKVGEVSSEVFSLNTASGTIDISAFFNEVKIQSASGNITLANPLNTGNNANDSAAEIIEDKSQLDGDNAPAKYVARSLSISTVSGNASISGYLTEFFSIHSVSGSTKVEGISGRGNVAATSGSITLDYAEWNNDLNISLVSGDVNVSLPEDSGATISLGGVSGMIRTDLGQSKGSFINLGKGTNGDFGGENKHKLSASLTSGTVTIARK